MQLKTNKGYKIKFMLKILTYILTLTIPAKISYGQQTNLVQSDTNISYTIIDTIQGQTVLKVCDKMPQFVGGDEALIKYMTENIFYPKLSDGETWQSKIYVSFIIDTIGKIRNAYVANPLNSGTFTRIEKICINMVENMPDWTPAENNGKKVPVRVNIPFRFDPSY